jgi:hypothetical protein
VEFDQQSDHDAEEDASDDGDSDDAFLAPSKCTSLGLVIDR